MPWTARWSIWRRSTGTCCSYSPDRLCNARIPDFDQDVRRVAKAVPPTGTLQRLQAVLACREALELNVKPRIAVEAMTVALRLP